MAGVRNDKQLLNTALRLSDAYDQPRLVFQISEGVSPVSILNLYSHARYPKQKVHCVHCGSKLHRRGFTAMLTTGDRVLFGSHCGADVFGHSWNVHAKAFEGEIGRQHELQRIERAKIVAPAMKLALRSWITPVSRLDATLRAFARQFPELWAGLAAAQAARSGQLTLPERVRDFAAEMRDRSESGALRFMMIEKVFASMSGGAIFETQRVEADRDEASAALAAYAEIFNATDGQTTSALKSRRMRFDRSLEKVESIYRLRQAADAFFDLHNLSVVATWAEKKFSINLTASGGQLADEESDVRIGLRTVPDFPTEPLELVREFRRAD